IEFGLLVKAAAKLEEIAEAGWTAHLMREFWARVREDEDARHQGNSFDDRLFLVFVNERASELCTLTGAPFDDCVDAIREASGRLPRREIGLQLLDELTQQIRKRTAQERRVQGCRRS